MNLRQLRCTVSDGYWDKPDMLIPGRRICALKDKQLT